MFRQEEVILGGWREKTIEAMQRRRFEAMVSRLPPLGANRLDALSPRSFLARIEGCWQDIEIKPMKAQQLAAVRKSVLGSVREHADCLSREEHDLVERALILGGSARIEDAQELEAANALSLRLWGSVGLVSGKPYIELEQELLSPIARAMARAEHEQIRQRFEAFSGQLSALLYQYGAMDDRLPQRMIQQEVLGSGSSEEHSQMLARQYLWASCDCIDYGGGVMLLHPALAEPHALLTAGCRPAARTAAHAQQLLTGADILPEEIPLQEGLERAISGVMRSGEREQDVARNLRYLCKQGAPVAAMEEVLQSSLIVLITPIMKEAIRSMFCGIPKWIECAQNMDVQ